jgi:hypothetical protein
MRGRVWDCRVRHFWGRILGSRRFLACRFLARSLLGCRFLGRSLLGCRLLGRSLLLRRRLLGLLRLLIAREALSMCLAANLVRVGLIE